MIDQDADNSLRDLLPEHITLYLTTPIDRTERMLREVMRRCEHSSSEPYPYILAMPISSNELHRFGLECARSLSPTERQLTKCWMAINGAEPSPAQLMQAQTLEDLISWIDGQWLSDVIRDSRLVTHFQPIVRAGSPSEVFGYECLLRGNGHDGELISPDRLFGAARATGMLHSLDLAARLTAIESAANQQLETMVFVNFNPRTIDDTERSLTTLLRATSQRGLSIERFVFEVVESEEVIDPDSLARILSSYRDSGCKVALDDLGAGYSSLNLLTRLKPDFIKIDIDLIRNVDSDSYKSCVAAKLLELARELGVGTVVEGVETEQEWTWARDYGADYAQGYLFARPAAEPPPSAFSGLDAQVSVS